jgi:hypothetical protein
MFYVIYQGYNLKSGMVSTFYEYPGWWSKKLKELLSHTVFSAMRDRMVENMGKHPP